MSQPIFSKRVIVEFELHFDLDEFAYEAFSNEAHEAHETHGTPLPHIVEIAGCGWGVLLEWMTRRVFDLSGDLEVATSSYDGLSVEIEEAQPDEKVVRAYYKKLLEEFEPAKEFIRNWPEERK